MMVVIVVVLAARIAAREMEVRVMAIQRGAMVRMVVGMQRIGVNVIRHIKVTAVVMLETAGCHYGDRQKHFH